MSGPSSPTRVSFLYTLDNKDNTVTFDASISEQHGGQAEVTDHPVEKGPNITDYVRPLPQRLTLEVMVSNTPIYPEILPPTVAAKGDPNTTIDSQSFQVGNKSITTPNMKALDFPEEFDRVKDVYDALVLAYKGAALIEVITTLATYENMVIVNLGVPRNVESSNAVTISIDLQEIILVESLEVETLAAKHQQKSRGQKPNKKPNDQQEQTSRSFAKSLVKGIQGAFQGGSQ